MNMNTNSYIGKHIGNYQVISEIASGSFGRVYLAQHDLLKKRLVAIKVLHTTRLDSTEEREEFLQEAQFLELLKHPYILSIIDVSIEDGLPYFIAEYAPNGSLRDRIRQNSPRPLPLKETINTLSQVGEALQYAHQKQIIHRDLKPENILFNADGEPLLADFGTTRCKSDSDRALELSGHLAILPALSGEGYSYLRVSLPAQSIHIVDACWILM
jgi:serine/threonine protein kinase